jgi:hypothetical protein
VLFRAQVTSARCAAVAVPRRADRSASPPLVQWAAVKRLLLADAHNVKGTFKDMIEVTKLLQVVTSFAAP